MKRLLAILMLLIWMSNINAAISANVDRTDIAMGESIILTINTPSNSQPDLSVLDKDFQIYGTSSSSSTTIINGKMNSQHQIIITLLPKHLGEITIPAIKIDNQTTQPITIHVSKPSQQQIGGKKSDIFVQTDLTNQSTYLNSPVIYSITFYYAISIQGLQVQPNMPSDISITPTGTQQTYTKLINGRTYHVIKQDFLLTPSRVGNITIPAVSIAGNVVSNDVGGLFGFGATKPFQVSSNALKLQVKPIPQGVDPNNWFPAKTVSINTQWSPQTQQLIQGQPITRTVTITATGVSVDHVPNVQFAVPENVNAYPDQPISKQKIINGELVSSKTYKIAYIPQATGKVIFPAIHIPWWNSTTGQKQNATIKAQSFPVKAGMLLQRTPSSNSTPQTNSQPQTNDDWRWVAYAFALLWIVTIIWVWLKFKRSKQAVTQAQVDLTQKKLLKAIKTACQSNDAQQLQQAIIVWAKNYWQNDYLFSLGQVTKLVDHAEFKQQLDILEQTIYKKLNYEKGSTLWQALQQYLLIEKENKATPDLPPLYPD